MKTNASAIATEVDRMHRVFFSILLLSLVSLSGISQNPKWAAWETEADTLMSHEDFKGAIKLYTKIIDASKLKDKTTYRPLYKRGVAHYSSGEFQKAILI